MYTQTNTFQAVLADNSLSSFVLFLYEDGGIQWTTGVTNGGINGMFYRCMQSSLTSQAHSLDVCIICRDKSHIHTMTKWCNKPSILIAMRARSSHWYNSLCTKLLDPFSFQSGRMACETHMGISHKL